MKKLIFGMMMLLSSTFTIAQQNPTDTQRVREDLLQRSKRQKTTGFIMLGVGAVAAIVGGALYAEDMSTTGFTLAGTGVLSMLGGVFFLTASSNNKEEAKAMTVGVKLERIPPGAIPRPSVYPEMAVRIQIR
jgi:undecaprenyl pyrophosphate phosphatase UppP